VIFVTNASSATTSTPGTNVPSTGTSQGHPHSRGPTATGSGDERPNQRYPEDSHAQLTDRIYPFHSCDPSLHSDIAHVATFNQSRFIPDSRVSTPTVTHSHTSHPFILDYQHAQDYGDLHSNPHDLHTALHIVATDTHHTQKELQDHTKEGRHPYTEDLLHIDSCRPTGPPEPLYSTDIVTPLNQQAWASALQNHPDQCFCRYICEGISRGFRIGFDYQSCTCKSATSNMASAKQHPQPVAKYLAEELEAKRIVGPLPAAMSSKIQVNRFGVIPKRSQPGKWRPIPD